MTPDDTSRPDRPCCWEIRSVWCTKCNSFVCPRCDPGIAPTPFHCRKCREENSGLEGEQATHDIGAVLEVARKENEMLHTACKACIRTMTECLDEFAGEITSDARWMNLRVARNGALEAIAKAEGQPPAIDGDGESGASTKVSSPPSEPMVVDVLVEFQDKLAQVIADLRPPTKDEKC